MAYTIVQKFISQNRSGKTLNAKGTVLHETATPGASDENEFNYFNSGYRGASAHAFVDYDSITQTVPWNEQSCMPVPLLIKVISELNYVTILMPQNSTRCGKGQSGYLHMFM